MKIKIFKIRLTDDHQVPDEYQLNLFLETVTTKKTSCQLVTNDTMNYWSILVFYDQINERDVNRQKSDKISFSVDTELSESEQNIYDAFKEWRFSKAKELNIPAYMICSNAELISLSKARPETNEQLLKIKGFGEQKIAKFGEEILALLNSL